MTKKTISLNEEQRKLVNDNLEVVEWAIRKHIHVNERVEGLEYDDLYQIGCMALCHAAVTYNGSVQFDTYAGVVVRNKLIDHCRSAKRRQKYTITASACLADGSEYYFSAVATMYMTH